VQKAFGLMAGPLNQMARKSSKAAQTEVSKRKNSSFFLDHIGSYSNDVGQLDTYANIRRSIEEAIRGTDLLLDIGNGGVFDYETTLAGRIVALDLFLDSLPETYRCPRNVLLRAGSALDIPEQDESFDTVLMVMLLHHLIGNTVRESIMNVRRAFVEAYRVLQPGGKLVIIESCIPGWFFGFERIVFSLAAPLINAALHHPATLQYTPSLIQELLTDETRQLPEVRKILLGRWVLQFGAKVPSALSPVTPYRFIVHKPLPA
jgi:ubiquinone/menaquinone biosynthesis C-methylase UbiE